MDTWSERPAVGSPLPTLPLWLATVIFLPLVGVSIWIGRFIPLDVQTLVGFSADKLGEANARNLDVLFCVIERVLVF